MHFTPPVGRGEAAPSGREAEAAAVAASRPGRQRLCPVCRLPGTPGDRPLGTLEAGKWGGPYELIQCGRCELIFLTPLPPQEVFDDMYVASPQFQGPAYRPERRGVIHEYMSGRMRALLTAMGTLDRANRVLEIGAGPSWMSCAAKSLHPDSLTVAQDITTEAVASSTWVDHYVLGELADRRDVLAQFAPYQVISMTHVIEHLPEPIEALALCRQWLDPRGIVFLTAPHRPAGWGPTSDFADWQKWSYSHVPKHLEYFNAASLKACAGKAGLRLTSFDASHEQGQAFEAWLTLPK